MKICTTRQEMLALSRSWADDGQTVCLVPTMGNLHDGHLSLLDIAADSADKVITSIYVNPLQFAKGEDFDTYPRTTQDDLDKLAASGKCHAVFMPQTMYEDGHATHIRPEGAALGLESTSRPHFFEGVATVVFQLFVQTAAHWAVFGEKDFQQLRVIQQMVRDLHMGIDIIAAPTVREADGLAMSSRNSYLDDQQRAAAPVLYQALQEAADAIRNARDPAVVLAEANERLRAAGFTSIDYLSLCEASTLAPLDQLHPGRDASADDAGEHGDQHEDEHGDEHEDAVLLAAARLGDVRLIDNVKV